MSRQDFKIPPTTLGRYLCNGMDPMEVVHSVGLYGPLPTRVLTARVSLDDGPPACPVTYVVLTHDKLLPRDVQERMAQRIPGIEIVTVDSCHQVMLYKPKKLADILLQYA